MGVGIFQIPVSSCVEKPKKTTETLIQSSCAKIKNFFTCLVPAVHQVLPSDGKSVTKDCTVEEGQLDSSQGQEIISVLKNVQIEAWRS